jgi:DME family drug/metabolite transporter
MTRVFARRRGLAGSAAILAAAALWGSTGTVAHFAPAGASPSSVGAARIVTGGVLLVLTVLRRDARQRRVGRPGTGLRIRWAKLGIGAVGIAGYQVCFFSGVSRAGVAIGTMVTIGSAPVFAGLISQLTGVAGLSMRWGIATTGAIAGCAVLLAGGRTAGVSPTGAGLALLAGLCYAGYAVAAGSLIGAGSSERSVMAIMFGGAAVLLAPILAVGASGWLLTWRGVVVVAELGVLATAVAYLLYGYGLRSVQVPTAVTLGLAEPVVASLLAVVVLDERLTGIAVGGLALVAASLAVLSVPRYDRRAS